MTKIYCLRCEEYNKNKTTNLSGTRNGNRSYLFNYYDCNSKKVRGYDKDIKKRW